MPGVIGVLTGREIKADGIGNLICGWMIHSKDGSPMKMGAWSPMAVDRVRYVGEAVAVVVADTKAQARDAAEAVEVTYEERPAVIMAAEAIKEGAPQLHPEADDNLIFDWEIGDAKAAEAAIAAAAHVTRIKIVQQPAGAERHGAARGSRPLRQGRGSLHLLDHLAESACRPAGAQRILQCRAREQAQGDRARRRRRFRLQNLSSIPRKSSACGHPKRTGVPVKWVADRTESFLTDAHGRDHVSEVEMAFDANNRITGLKVDTIANLGAYMSLFSSSVPTYLYATLLSGQYDIPAIHANVRTVYTNTTPVDAYRGAGRPEATYLVERTIETAARELGVSPAELGGPTSSRRSRTRRR